MYPKDTPLIQCSQVRKRGRNVGVIDVSSLFTIETSTVKRTTYLTKPIPADTHHNQHGGVHGRQKFILHVELRRLSRHQVGI